MEALRKTVTGRLNWRLMTARGFHNTPHVFRAVWGIGTASIESKMLQHLTQMGEEVLYEIFLELQKLYDALDRDGCLDILSG